MLELFDHDSARFAPPGPDGTRGGAGVRGEEIDHVYVLVDNARLNPGDGPSDGVFRFNLSDLPTEAPNTLYVNRSLAAVKSVRIDEFSWPTLPAQAAPKTNRKEVSALIREISQRACVHDVRIKSHFRGYISMKERLMFLHSTKITTGATGEEDSITQISNEFDRDIGGIVKWYQDATLMEPPVNLRTLELELRLGDRAVVFQPYRIRVVFSKANPSIITMADGSAHNLLDSVFDGTTVIVDVAGTEGDGATAISELSKDTEINLTFLVEPFPIGTAAETHMQSDVDLSGITGAFTDPVTVLVPCRRVRIGLDFEVYRRDRD